VFPPSDVRHTVISPSPVVPAGQPVSCLKFVSVTYPVPLPSLDVAIASLS